MANKTEDFSLAEFADYSKSLNEAARNLYKLLENLLEWAQVQKGAIDFNPKDSDLSKMVSQSIETIYQRALQKRIEIINEIDKTQKVYADEKMIGTVLRNLLSNAVKFTRKDGKTIIKSGQSDDGKIEVSVEDNGVGISEKNIKRLFKIEEKVSSQGTDGESSTGLGLLLCKEFIERNGGKIWVESEEGKGSTFYFTLRERK
jgi:signal transduction histidine kinase